MNTTPAKHEKRDVNVPALFIIVLLLFLSSFALFAIVGGMMRFFRLHHAGPTEGLRRLPAAHAAEFPGPRLELNAPGDLAQLRAAEENDLNSFGWVDRAQGRVRVPIGRAMEILLQRGLPEVGTGQTPLQLMQSRPAEKATPPSGGHGA